MSARAVMVLGTTSGAGKSWLATALCRWYARAGVKVAPFKAQNMSNNARVVPGLDDTWGEMGSAQYFQALAARARPDVRMNPILLKPERDTASQVVVQGRVRPDLASVPWRQRSDALWPIARQSLHHLLAENEVLVIEGAGSPAEINLHASDYVNMRTAREAQAACLLVADIDRGGAFAHLFGTHQLLPPDERSLLRGFVLNKFRGDESLLAPGPAQLQALTGVPTLAVLPLWRGHGLPEEDGVFDGLFDGAVPPSRSTVRTRIAIIAFPHISNLDEFQPLRDLEGVTVVWAREVAACAGADWIVLPGSKNTAADRAWMRAEGLDGVVARHAAAGGRVLGICGGLQILGGRMRDPHGIEGDEHGLDLLDLETDFERDKLVRPTRALFTGATGAWEVLADLSAEGYEIHHGRTHVHARAADAGTAVAVLNQAGQAIGWQRGSVLGVYVHGLFETEAVVRALLGVQTRDLDSVFEGLADFIDARFAPGVLGQLAGMDPRPR